MIDCSITPPGPDYWPSVIHHSSPCRHVTASTIPAEMIPSTFRTKILLSKTPHLLCRIARTFPDSMRRLFAAEKMPTTAHVRIDSFVDPTKFGTDCLRVIRRVGMESDHKRRAVRLTVLSGLY